MTRNSSVPRHILPILLLHIPIAVAAACAHAADQPVGMVEQPCPPALEPPPALRDLLVRMFIEPRRITAEDLSVFMNNPQLQELTRESARRAAQDWPGLCRYREANLRMPAAPASPRVVLMGDSITENWMLADPAFFDRRIVNRGISGQTTAQMLVRFRADVVALHPKAVHIMGGTNDVAGNTGPTSVQDFKNNIMSMVDIARANGIEVVIANIPPTASFSWRPQVNPRPRVDELNQWLRAYSVEQRIDFIDYHTALAGAGGELRSDLGNDGVHPNRNGYAIMRRMFEAVIL